MNVEPVDATLFKAFQANLLSLISHELRTPLMGVLNALGVLAADDPLPGLSQKEWIAMAYSNAQRLHQTLVTLLDLAAVESGTFHARLREVDLLRLVRAGSEAIAKKRKIEVSSTTPDAIVLADPQKLGRVLDLCFEVAAARAEKASAVKAEVSRGKVEFFFALEAGAERDWDSDWQHGAAGFEAGVGSSASAFGGVVQSEEAFLTRMREGLGSDFILIHQIMRLHGARCLQKRKGCAVSLALEFSALSPEEGLKAILLSRAYVVSHELGSVALALIEVPAGTDEADLRAKVGATLFRATDAVYALPTQGQIALILDDCKPQDAARVMERIERSTAQKLRFGVAHCPEDGLDPAKLVGLAKDRLGQGK